MECEVVGSNPPNPNLSSNPEPNLRFGCFSCAIPTTHQALYVTVLVDGCEPTAHPVVALSLS